MTEETSWEVQCDNAAWAFGQQCRDFKKSNPYDLVALEHSLRDAVPEFRPTDDTQVKRQATVVAFPGRRARH